MKITTLFLSICALLVASLCSAQTVPSKLDSLLSVTLQAQRNSLNVKGLSAAIQFSDGSVWASASGISSEIPAVPADTAQAFGFASITKTITAACILKMADEGLLHLDDSLHQWLDTFRPAWSSQPIPISCP